VEQELLRQRAQAWAEADPDPETRREIEQLLAQGEYAELRERFGAELDFGTAGLRGAVGAGPARMNSAVIVRATRALAEHLLERVPDARVRPVIVGYDARLSSRAFAEAAAEVLLGAGLPVRWFEAAVPTPLVAYVARVLLASAAIVVTASHNPRDDNGMKIYGPDAIQLGSPADADVARRREHVGSARLIPRGTLRVAAGGAEPLLQTVEPALLERYRAELDAALPPRATSPGVRTVYTPIHGVGRDALLAMFELRGLLPPRVVAGQAEPDGTFPTTPFPNPELPGVLDSALALAKAEHAELVLANDPDADRLAAAVRLPSGNYRVLSGNELAVLFADFLLSRAESTVKPLLVTSIVSTPLLKRLAEEYGARCELTLTGFKWIWAAAQALTAQGYTPVLGCEEALGYSIGGLVRDKDGIAAAVWLAELAELEHSAGRSVLDRLHGIYRRHGAWSSSQRTLTRPGSEGARDIAHFVERLVSAPPSSIGGRDVRSLFDYRAHAEARPRWLGRSSLIVLELADSTRVLVRPSGTEPKLKIYVDARCALASSESVMHAEANARAQTNAISDAMATWLQS